MIGTGQFGVVYRAEINDETQKTRQVAIKTLKSDMVLDGDEKVSYFVISAVFVVVVIRGNSVFNNLEINASYVLWIYLFGTILYD